MKERRLHVVKRRWGVVHTVFSILAVIGGLKVGFDSVLYAFDRSFNCPEPHQLSVLSFVGMALVAAFLVVHCAYEKAIDFHFHPKQ